MFKRGVRSKTLQLLFFFLTIDISSQKRIREKNMLCYEEKSKKRQNCAHFLFFICARQGRPRSSRLAQFQSRASIGVVAVLVHWILSSVRLEQLAHNQFVLGSNPRGSTTYPTRLLTMRTTLGLLIDI